MQAGEELLGAFHLADLCGHRRVNVAGADGVHAYASGPVGHRELSGDPDDAVLGGDVCACAFFYFQVDVLGRGAAEQAVETGDRGGVDDRPASALGQRCGAVEGAVVDAAEVDVDGSIPAVLAAADAGVVEDHVEPAQHLDGLGEGVLDRVLGGDVQLHGGRAAAVLGDLGRGRLCALDIDVRAHHRGALRGHAQRRGLADAGAGAGDQRHSPLKSIDCHMDSPSLSCCCVRAV